MAVEIVAGVVFGSMALLADGLHMASHASALAISLFAYVYARRHAHDERFCFGTGKVNSLAGFTGAVLLALFALLMAWESIGRLLNPVEIAFNQAIGVAVLGLIVNGLSVFVLGGGDPHDHHDGGHEESPHAEHHHEHHDHNLRSAYLHVLADALTSVLAIFALLGGKYLGLNWLDPVMGVVGAILVARWSTGLLRTTSRVLLDHQGPDSIRHAIRQNLEELTGVTVVDLHLWQIGPGIVLPGRFPGRHRSHASRSLPAVPAEKLRAGTRHHRSASCHAPRHRRKGRRSGFNWHCHLTRPAAANPNAMIVKPTGIADSTHRFGCEVRTADCA